MFCSGTNYRCLWTGPKLRLEKPSNFYLSRGGDILRSGHFKRFIYRRTHGNRNRKHQKFSCLYPKYTNLVVFSIPTSSFFFNLFCRTCLSPPFFVLGPAWISYWMALAVWHKTHTLTNFRHPPRQRWRFFTTSAASAMPAMLCEGARAAFPRNHLRRSHRGMGRWKLFY